MGATLPNGATLLLSRLRGDGAGGDGGYVVLAIVHDDEYVTWRADPAGNCYWGHYFQDDLAGAVRSYMER